MSIRDTLYGQVGSLAVPNCPGGVVELEFSFTDSAVFSARPDLVTGLVNSAVGTYVISFSEELEKTVTRVTTGVVRAGASTVRAVQFDANASTQTAFTFLVTNTAGALVDLGAEDGIHVCMRFRRDGGSGL